MKDQRRKVSMVGALAATSMLLFGSGAWWLFAQVKERTEAEQHIFRQGADQSDYPLHQVDRFVQRLRSDHDFRMQCKKEVESVMQQLRKLQKEQPDTPPAKPDAAESGD